MKSDTAIIKRMVAAVVCLALLCWSITPSFTHAPTVFETIHDHLKMVQEHGHSHGFEEDLFWALHGHDVADHDHSQAFLVPSQSTTPSLAFSTAWWQMASTDGPAGQFRIDRPPWA